MKICTYLQQWRDFSILEEEIREGFSDGSDHGSRFYEGEISAGRNIGF
jgi:hypothetical protein